MTTPALVPRPHSGGVLSVSRSRGSAAIAIGLAQVVEILGAADQLMNCVVLGNVHTGVHRKAAVE